jgi:hypothetical protein
VRIDKRFWMFAGICSAALTLFPLSASASASTETNCCFELSVEGESTASLNYGDQLPQPYHGQYILSRLWSVRSIVSFRQTSSDHRAALVEQATEARLTTEESSTLSERHARLDEHGNYTYPYEPILCSGPMFPEPNQEQPHSENGVVSLPQRSSGYRLRVDVDSLFGSQPPTCGGGADIALHAKEGADDGVAELPAPKLDFFRLASEGDRKSRIFEAPRVSIAHGGVSGFHTFENQRRATVQFSWFPKARLKAEGDRLRDLKCGPQYCDQDNWGS